MNEKNVKKAVCDYLTGRLFRDFSVIVDDNEPDLCAIHFGSTRNGTADVVLRNTEGHFITIAECKAPSIGNTDKAKKQLASYLNSTGTRFGILAASINSDDWIFAENLGGNQFRPIDKAYFEEYVFDPPTIEWTQQNVLKWKSEAQKWESKAEQQESEAQKWESKAEQQESEAQKWESKAEQQESEAQKWESKAEQQESEAQKWKSETQRKAGFLGILVPSSIVIAIALAIVIAVLLFRNSSPSSNGFANRDDLYQVVRIIDGDTVEIEYEGALTSVQLIGVNAPETVHPRKPVEPYGKEATVFLQKLVLNRFVYFEFNGSKKDKYNRLLAYVYRDSDNLFVNLEIIRQGYGKTDARFPFNYMKLFQYHESQARTARKGVWSR